MIILAKGSTALINTETNVVYTIEEDERGFSIVYWPTGVGIPENQRPNLVLGLYEEKSDAIKVLEGIVEDILDKTFYINLS